MVEEEAQLPLLFLTPPGWPEPDIHWRAGHQGWMVPERWLPRSDARPTPGGWKFWKKNPPVWNRLVSLRRRAPLVWLWVGLGLFAVSFIAVCLQIWVGLRLEHLWLWSAIAGFTVVLAAISQLTDVQARVLRDIQESSVEARRVIDEALYAEYLRTWRP